MYTCSTCLIYQRDVLLQFSQLKALKATDTATEGSAALSTAETLCTDKDSLLGFRRECVGRRLRKIAFDAALAARRYCDGNCPDGIDACNWVRESFTDGVQVSRIISALSVCH